MKNKLESLVGFIILLIAVSFSVSIYKNTGMRALEDTYNVKAKFDQVEGIVTGSDVRISGVKVGSVVTLDLDPIEYHAVMTIALNKKIKLPRRFFHENSKQRVIRRQICIDRNGRRTKLF